MATIKGSSVKGWYAYLEYTVTQSIPDNKSTIKFTLKVHDDSGYSYNGDPNGANYTMPGRSKTYKTYNFPSVGEYTIASTTVTVNHNSDGTGSYAASAVWNSANETTYTPASLSVSGNITLPTIPRKSTMTFPTFTLGSSGTITIDRKSTSFTHTIRYKFGSASGTIGTGINTSKSWTPPLSLATQIPNATSGKGTLTLVTYSGNTTIGTTTAEFTALVPSSVKPTMSALGISKVNANAWIAEKDIYVQGYSKVRVQSTASGNQGSTIKSYAVTVGTKSYSGADITSAVLPAGTVSINSVATDSRGRTASRSASITVLPYTKPIVGGLTFARGAYSDGVWTDNDNGADVKITFTPTMSLSEQGNTLTAAVSAEDIDAQTRADVNGAQDFYFVGVGVDQTKTFTVTLTDSLGNTTNKGITVPTVAVPLNLNMDLPGIGIGKVAEAEKTVDIANDWEVKYGGKTHLELFKQFALEVIYPVKSYWISEDPTSPADIIGGTWTRVKSAFIYAIGDDMTAGTVGGSNTHTLTEAELPVINGKINNIASQSANYGITASGAFSMENTSGGTSGYATSWHSPAKSDNVEFSIGGGQAFSTMPKYRGAYVWRRTA